jgi:hypothetical protein
MAYFSIRIRIFGTLYVKASSQSEGERVLRRLCSNSLDASDRGWFSEADFRSLPRASFGTSFTLDSPLDKSALVKVTKEAISSAQQSFDEGTRRQLLPNGREFEQFWDMPVFTDDLEIVTTAFIRANSKNEAQTIADNLTRIHIDLETEYWRWFSDLGFDEAEEWDMPVVLSSSFQLVGPADSSGMFRRWPDITYTRGESGEDVETVVKIPKKRIWLTAERAE